MDEIHLFLLNYIFFSKPSIDSHFILVFLCFSFKVPLTENVPDTVLMQRCTTWLAYLKNRSFPSISNINSHKNLLTLFHNQSLVQKFHTQFLLLSLTHLFPLSDTTNQFPSLKLFPALISPYSVS